MEKNFGSKNNKWQPGQSGNPAGRPKGAKSIVSAKHIREEIARFVNDHAFPDLFKNFHSFTNKDKIFFVTKILPYITPTLSATKNENIDGSDSKIRFQIVYDDTPSSSDNDIDDADYEQLPPDDKEFDF